MKKLQFQVQDEGREEDEFYFIFRVISKSLASGSKFLWAGARSKLAKRTEENQDSTMGHKNGMCRHVCLGPSNNNNKE